MFAFFQRDFKTIAKQEIKIQKDQDPQNHGIRIHSRTFGNNLFSMF
jgi:hypothetical protein